MSAAFKFLVVADDTPEFPAAFLYASLRARATRAGLVILRVIEPIEPAAWVSVGEEMRRQAWAAAEALVDRFASEAWAEAGITPEKLIREGDLRTEFRKAVESDPAIKIVTLAAGAGAGGPGPLVSAALKGQAFGPDRALPIVIVPSGVSVEQIRSLADPGPQTAAGDIA